MAGIRRLSVGLLMMLLCRLSLAGTGVEQPGDAVRPCGKQLLGGIPARAANAPTGDELALRVFELSGPARDALILTELMQGNIPAFLRHLVPVTVSGETARGAARITVCVLPDYLAVGSNANFLYVPLGLKAALQIAIRFRSLLPTPKLVDAIYAASAVKLTPEPLPASDSMRTTAYVLEHTRLIDLQRALHLEPLGVLTAGDKKDLVLTGRLWSMPGRVAIYGWHRLDGEPIQPLSTVHGERYADYSHGVRLVSHTVYVNGVERRLEDVLADPMLAPLLTREGALPHLTRRLAALLGQPTS